MDNSAILFLHGWAAHAGVFVKQLGVFKDGFSLIAPDIFTLMPEDREDTFSLDIALDVLSEEITGRNIENLIIFGWSFGGILAAKLANRLSDITKGVIFCGFSPVFTKGDKNPYGMEASAIDKLRERIDLSAPDAIEEFVKLVMYGYQYTCGFEMISEIILDEISDDKKGVLLDSLSVLADGDFTDAVRAIGAKTLIIHGSEDKLCQKEAVLEMTKIIKDCKVEMLDGASHIPFFTNAEEFNKVFKEFLKSFE